MVETFRNIFTKIRKRPALLIFTASITLICCAVEQFNPLTREYGTFGSIFGATYLPNLNTWAEKLALMMRNPMLLTLLLLTVILLLVACAALLGITYSGFTHQMLRASDDAPVDKKEIQTGISRHSLKLSLYFLLAIPATVIFVIITLYTLVPAILSVKLFFTGSSSIFFPMLLICIITILVDFVAILFFTMYATFTFPALVCFKKGGFRVAIKMVNAYCWYLLPRTLLFLVANIGLRLGLLGIHYGLGSGAASVAVLIVTWVIRVFIDFLYLNFVFNTFSAMKSDMYGIENESER